MPTCAVKNCSNNTRNSLKKHGVSYFIFPKNPTRRSDWTTIIRRNRGEKFYEPPGFSHVCSVHFHPSDIYTTAGGFKRLSKSARPTLQMVTQTGSASTSQQSDRDLLDPNDQSDSSLISDPEETSGAPGTSGPDVGQKTLSVVFLCKACLKNITSFRYRCLVCPDYEMCGECERRGGHHDDHYVLRVPMQRPTVEIDQVETAVRRALSSFPIWNKAFKSTAKPKVVKKKLIKTTVNKPDKTKNSEDSMDDTGSDSEDTEDEPSDTEKKPEKAIPKLVTIKTEAVDSDDEPVVKVRKSGTIKTEAVDSVDEPVVKVELVIKEEEDPLEEEDAASAILQNIHERQTTSGSKDDPPTQVVPSYHIAQSSQGVPWSYIVPLTHGAPKPQSVPPAQGVPPSKRRRADEHRSTTTTHSHKTGLCTETSSSLTAVTSSETGSKVDVFVLKKRTRPADENYD